MMVYCQAKVRFKGRTFTSAEKRKAQRCAKEKQKKQKKAVKAALHKEARRITVTWRER